jgi:hypothetical protein
VECKGEESESQTRSFLRRSRMITGVRPVASRRTSCSKGKRSAAGGGVERRGTSGRGDCGLRIAGRQRGDSGGRWVGSQAGVVALLSVGPAAIHTRRPIMRERKRCLNVTTPPPLRPSSSPPSRATPSAPRRSAPFYSRSCSSPRGIPLVRGD